MSIFREKKAGIFSLAIVFIIYGGIIIKFDTNSLGRKCSFSLPELRMRKFKVIPHPLNLDARKLLADLGSSRPKAMSPINLKYTSIRFSKESMHCAREHLKSFSILIMVKTRPSEEGLRMKFRDCFQNQTLSLKNLPFIQYGFLVGQSGEDISAEISAYDDFVIGDFLDAYQNLTHKVMMGIRWATEVCPQFDFYLSLDIDAHIFLKNLVKLLKDPYSYPEVDEDTEFGSVLSPNKHFFGGSGVLGHPDRNPNSMWYLSREAYPSATFPRYHSGMVVIMSKETVSSFYKLSPFVQHINVDDVYWGILANKLGIVPFEINEFVFNAIVITENDNLYTEDFYLQGYLNDALTIHHIGSLPKLVQKRYI